MKPGATQWSRWASAVVLWLTAGPVHPADTPLQLQRELPRTDVAVAGVGGIGAAALNGGGAGTLVLNGVSGEIRSAWLYWHGIDWTSPVQGFVGGNEDYDEHDIVFDGVTLTGTRLAQFASNNCWPVTTPPNLPPTSAAAYRAEVTEIVRARGVGEYSFSGLADGAGHSANGLSLLVYYDDGQPDNDWHVREFAGADENQWQVPWVIQYQGAEVEVILHVADGQSAFDPAMRISAEPRRPNGDLSVLEFQGMPEDNTSPWPGNSVPLMDVRRLSHGLWDIRRFTLGALFGPMREYTVVITDDLTGSDCISLVALQVLERPQRRTAAVEPSPFDFGEVQGGTQSPAQVFTVTNHMSLPIVLETARTLTTWFTPLGNSCDGQTLQPGGQCTITLACTPSNASRSTESGYLIVPWHTATAREIDGSFYTAIDCASYLLPNFSSVAMAPAVHDFGPISIGEASPSFNAVLRNTGNVPITLVELVNPISGFLREPGGCAVGMVLAPDASCDITVHYVALGVPETTHASEVQVKFSATDDASDRIRLRLLAINDSGDRLFADGFE